MGSPKKLIHWQIKLTDPTCDWTIQVTRSRAQKNRDRYKYRDISKSFNRQLVVAPGQRIGCCYLRPGKLHRQGWEKGVLHSPGDCTRRRCLACSVSYYPLTVKLSLCGPYLLNLKFEVDSVLRDSGGSLSWLPYFPIQWLKMKEEALFLPLFPM